MNVPIHLYSNAISLIITTLISLCSLRVQCLLDLEGRGVALGLIFKDSRGVVLAIYAILMK